MLRADLAQAKLLLALLPVVLLLALTLLRPAPSGTRTLRIATTTSLDATGLLAALKSEFEKRHPGVEVTWVALGTGQALEVAKRGDVDLVLTHDRPLEDEFIRQGYGVHGVSFA
jgi:ABC-type tungstate transport system, permease component